MQRRVLAAAIAFICVIPAVAHAQLMPLQDDPSWGPRLRITPFVGFMPSVTRHENWIHSPDGGATTFESVDYKLSGGNALGFIAENVIRGPWSAIAGIAYTSRGESVFTTASDELSYEINGSRFVMVKLGGSYTLHEAPSELTMRRLSASVFAAPFYLREMPRSELGFDTLNVFDASNHFGLNLGVAAELPFAKDKMSLQIGVEDYWTNWDSDALGHLASSFLNESNAGSVRVENDNTHNFLLRAGISYRWR